MKIHLLRAFAGVGALVLFGVLSGVARGQTTPQMVFRPSLVERCAVSYSYSGGAGFRDGVEGETSVERFDASMSGRRMIGRGLFLGAGFAVGVSTIRPDEGVAAPERLGEVSVNVGVTQMFSRKASVSVFARPGYYGDFEHFTWRTFNVPVMAMAMYAPSPKYSFMLGAGYSRFSQYRVKVMPVLGFRWKFAEDWTLNFGIPRLGVTWQASRALEISAHASGQGGTYRTTEAPNGSGRVDLANTFVSYREIRLGVRATHVVAKKVSVAFEGGWMAERRFYYYERDFKLRGRPSAYMTLAVDVRM